MPRILSIATTGALAIAGLFCTPLHAQQNAARAVAQCDRLTASDMDAATIPGVPVVAANNRAAVLACTAAVKADPRNGRILYQFGRALAAVNRHEEARKAYRLAASLGYANGMVLLAVALEQGFGGPRNLAQAHKLREKAAAAGHPGAMFALGRMDAAGIGAPRNDAAARRWDEQAVRGFEKLVAAGSSQAAYLLARAHREGRGVPADSAKAAELLTMAATRGHPAAMFDLARRAEDNRDYAGARDWYVKAGKIGHVPSMINLGRLYEDGRVGNRHPQIAEKLYELAAAQGDRRGAENLARLRRAGR